MYVNRLHGRQWASFLSKRMSTKSLRRIVSLLAPTLSSQVGAEKSKVECSRFYVRKFHTCNQHSKGHSCLRERHKPCRTVTFYIPLAGYGKCPSPRAVTQWHNAAQTWGSYILEITLPPTGFLEDFGLHRLRCDKHLHTLAPSLKKRLPCQLLQWNVVAVISLVSPRCGIYIFC